MSLMPTIPPSGIDRRRIKAKRLPLRLDTPAKINPFLRVVGTRPDGYHDLETVFLPLRTLVDQVIVAPAAADELRLKCAAPGVPGGADNLAWRAADAFAKFAGITPGWNITVRKEIPVAAGLGGGSSDAAAVLRILHGAYPGLAGTDVMAIAARLGADVPFFLCPRPSVARGIGDALQPIKMTHPLPLLLVFPDFPISTAWSYGCWQPDPSPGILEPMCSALRFNNIDKVCANLANDLAPAAFAKFPLLRLIRGKLLDLGATAVGMSGSGPTLFACCASLDEAQRLANLLPRSFHGVRCLATVAG
jgi:4-diphosphocytidyl-2-C-methyl-D-erythritol kinase